MQTFYTDDRFDGLRIEWNGSATFTIWIEGDVPHHHTENGWTCTDCFTHYGTAEPAGPCTAEEAAEAVESHFDNIATEEA
jgi:hypothetical protein